MKKLTDWQRGWVRVVVTIAVVFVAWSIFFPSATWRYNLTVEVNTPEGVKTGNAVRQITARRMPNILPEMQAIEYSVKGEAVVVDLGARGTLFALLRSPRFGTDGWRYIVFDAFPSETKGRERLAYYKSLTGQSKTLAVNQYPTLVRFRDPADPKTVEAVKPDDFAASFGPGVALKSVTIEMTREPVTTGVVERYLPWVYSIKSNLDGTSVTTSRELANNLDWGSFVRGKR